LDLWKVVFFLHGKFNFLNWSMIGGIMKLDASPKLLLHQISIMEEELTAKNFQLYDRIKISTQKNCFILQIVKSNEICSLVHPQVFSHLKGEILNFEKYKESKEIKHLSILCINSQKIEKFETFFGKSIFENKNEEWLEDILKRKFLNQYLTKNCISLQKIAGEYFQFNVLNDVDGFVSLETEIEVHKEKMIKNKFKKLGGLELQEKVLKELLDSKFELKLKNSPKSVLVYGAQGNGKSEFVNQISDEYASKYSMRIISMSGNQNQIRNLITGIEEQENIIFIIDNFEIHQEESIAMIYGILDIVKNSNSFVIGICENIENVNSIFRSSGNFEYEIYFPIPNTLQRRDILRIYFPDMNSDLIEKIADFTSGYVGKDLERLSKYSKLLTKEEVDWEIISSILRSIQPNQLKDFGVKIPKITFDEIGGYEKVKKKLKQILLLPFEKNLTKFNIPSSTGILLYGPSGNGKTMFGNSLVCENSSDS
jgi:AAA+ superfamily predicted ATPase